VTFFPKNLGQSRRLEANALTAISKVSSAKGEHASAISSFPMLERIFIPNTQTTPSGGGREAVAAAVGIAFLCAFYMVFLGFVFIFDHG